MSKTMTHSHNMINIANFRIEINILYYDTIHTVSLTARRPQRIHRVHYYNQQHLWGSLKEDKIRRI